jgi:hypothetical protein
MLGCSCEAILPWLVYPKQVEVTEQNKGIGGFYAFGASKWMG